MVDTFGELLNNDRMAFILNTDISTGNGIHWITLMPIDNKVFIVDSLSKNNNRPYDYIMFDTINDYNMEPYFYNGEFQYDNDSLCGWFAIYISNMLNNYKHKITLAIANKLVFNEFGKTPDDEDIYKLIKAFGIKSRS